MPPNSEQRKPSFRALVTGSGPFLNVPINPAWLTAEPLHNTTIQTPSSSIHITAIGPLKVTYASVLAVIPNLHARPPRLPPPGSENGSTPGGAVPPPPEGFEFVFHLGVGRSGNLSLEQVGHQSGYEFPGVDGKLAPVISGGGHEGSKPPSAAEDAEAARLGISTLSHKPKPHVKRGFAKGYERFPENLHTEVDVQGVIAHLKKQGESRVVASTDAGYYLCDYMCYCGLAESQRPLFYPGTGDKNARRSKSLFMHVTPEGDPYTIEEMKEAVRQIIAWVCTGEKALPPA